MLTLEVLAGVVDPCAKLAHTERSTRRGRRPRSSQSLQGGRRKKEADKKGRNAGIPWEQGEGATLHCVAFFW